ncbi:hypothetical protein M433DRAFT_145774 [Acidomyces richmondensis BFW]|nr:MAG: hypothetical protein FE78DRAFT_82483 [Acidomyces sp. 'richmondensis']KYG43515.1 hypothetical protein M433DRAFT_145774 [Acidomyces richmondensis BFW]
MNEDVSADSEYDGESDVNDGGDGSDDGEIEDDQCALDDGNDDGEDEDEFKTKVLESSVVQQVGDEKFATPREGTFSTQPGPSLREQSSTPELIVMANLEPPSHGLTQDNHGMKSHQDRGDPTVRKTASSNSMAWLHREDDYQCRGRVESSETEVPRKRAASMTEYCKIKGLVKLRPMCAAKASPAECAITACSVRPSEPAKLNTVYEHHTARYRNVDRDKRPTKTAQTVASNSTLYQMVWEEPPMTTSEDDVTLFEEPANLDITEQEDSLLANISRSPSPMGKVKTKLTAWSWAKEPEEDDNAGPQFLPLLDLEDDHHLNRREISTPGLEEPPAPPNTEASSARNSGPSSARHSAPQTPYEEGGGDEEDSVIQYSTIEDVDQDGDDDEPDENIPIELRFKASLSRSRSATMPTAMPSSSDYLNVSGVRPGAGTRQLSNLETYDEHFRNHRNSVDVYRRHLANDERMNPHLAATQDSFVLTKSKYESRFPKNGGGSSTLKSFPTIQYSRFGGLSPILDASPPDARSERGVEAMAKLARVMRNEIEERERSAHPIDHVGCPVCEVEWMKWFEAKRQRQEHES